METKTELTTEDIALYLGCDAMFGDDDSHWDGKINPADLQENRTWHVKPILRPLSDMTEDEENKLDELAQRLDIALDSEDIDDISVTTMASASITFWFIRQGFDVFKWIESGLALDKTKRKVTP